VQGQKRQFHFTSCNTAVFQRYTHGSKTSIMSYENVLLNGDVPVTQLCFKDIHTVLKLL